MIGLRDEYILCNNLRERAYAPYSNYTVGATLVCKNGKKYTGCNVENHGIQGICAERTAFVKAISEGEREFSHIVIMGGKKGESAEKCTPCGYCRQFMSEFVGNDFKIYNIHHQNVDEYTIEDLLPYSFELKEDTDEDDV